jgi:DNA-binding PadR family transcriptional regulator/sugar-specific transcriptional regulator TrmB
MTIGVQQEIVSTSKNLFSVLSRDDNLKMFEIAKNGLKISLSILDKLEISPKRYYKALKQLKDAGLIEKRDKNGGIYFHTIFGSIVYQRNITEMDQYAKHLEKMQMIDSIRQTEKFSEASILKLTQDIIGTALMSSSPPSFQSTISESINNTTSRLPIADIILSYDKVIQTLVERVDCCKSEILITTRICPEIVINKILEKSKLGVKVKVVADIDLVKEYFRPQQKFLDNLNEKNPIEERKCVIANPWYPDNSINRRIADIPFGVIILDKQEVGVELVNCNNPKEFYGGIFIRDEKIAMNMTDFFHQIWEKASESIDAFNEQKVE